MKRDRPNTGNFQGEMNAIWDHLYPAFGADAMPEDVACGRAEKVKQTIAGLEAHLVKKQS